MNNFDSVYLNVQIIDTNGIVCELQNIGITDNLITYVGKDSITGKITIDLKGKFVTASLVNTHSHAPMSLLRGLAEDVDINSWFNDHMWQYESSMKEDDVYLGSKLGFFEMINNGITLSNEHYFMPESIIKAAEEIGIKVDMAPTFFSGEESKMVIKDTIELSNKYKSSNQIDISFGPHSTYLTNEEDLKYISKISEENNMKIHIHVGESQVQIDEHIKKYNMTPLKWLQNLDVLNTKCTIAHNLYYEKEDLELLNDNHLISYCPKTYLKLAMGLSTMKLEELNYSFGTDGAASNATLDVIEQARILALYEKDRADDATTAPLKQIWKKLFTGHKHFSFNTGEIKTGYSADFIVWDLLKPNTMPIVNPLASIIYSSNSENIHTVVSGGKVLKENGIVIGFDEQFIKEVEESIHQIQLVGKQKAKYKF